MAGLAAKPVIDIAAGIDDPDDEVAYLPDLVAAGWDLRVREPGHRCLRAEPPVRARYAALKRSLSGRQWPDMNLNADAKGNPDTRAARGNPGVSRLPVRTGPAALTCGVGSRAVSERERQRFAVAPAEGEVDGIDLARLDPADEHERRLLIEAEHPELRRALGEGQREIRLAGDVINPRLHIVMHEIVANQLWADDPPEAWTTAQRLVDAGYERHEVLHMLASVVTGEVFEILRHDQAHDIDRIRKALAALPGEWEQRRADLPAQRHRNRAERRAAARRRG